LTATPRTGVRLAYGVTGGSMLAGTRRPVGAYPLEVLPAIVPIRVANQRVLSAYLDQPQIT